MEQNNKQKAKLYRQRSYLKKLILSNKTPTYKCDEVYEFYNRIKSSMPNLLESYVEQRKELAEKLCELEDYLDSNKITEFNFYIKKQYKIIDAIELNKSVDNEQKLIEIFKETIDEINLGLNEYKEMKK